MSFVNSPNLSTINDVIRKLEEFATNYPIESEIVSVEFLEPGRTLAENIQAEIDIPAVRISNVDGFAMAYNQSGTKRKIVGLSTAVTPYRSKLQPGESVRITNGGLVPEGADTVVPYKDVVLIKEMEFIDVQKILIMGENICDKGSGAKTGEILMRAGDTLDSRSICLLHALGVSQVVINYKPRVCVMSICNGRNPLKVYGDVNRAQLLTLFQNQGFVAIDAGNTSETSFRIKKSIRLATKFACVIVTLGGDMQIRRTAQDLNMTFEIEQIASTPGNFAFASGIINKKLILLCMFPREPGKSWIGANLLVSPFLRAMEGRTVKTSQKQNAILTQPLSRRTSQLTFLRARSECIDGQLMATPLGHDEISPANAILEVPPDSAYSIGDVVNVFICS